jgi:hypothetical protein
MFDILGHDGLCPVGSICLLIFIVFDARLLNLLSVCRLGFVVVIHDVGSLSQEAGDIGERDEDRKG